MKKVLIIIAPMGFGPASNGLYIANKLSLYTELSIATMGDAYDFVAKFAPNGVVCQRGGITSLFTFEEINSFDIIISINNVPAVTELTRIGLGNKVILFDSLLQWRKEKTNIRLHKPIYAYLVQDFPGVSQCSYTCQAQHVQLVAPMILSSGRTFNQRRTREGVILCFGGITSALVNWDNVKVIIKSLIMDIHKICKQLGTSLTVIGNDCLCEFKIENDDSLNILGMVDPIMSYELIANSQLLMTTPGIGTVYEGVGASTPIILMPPTNSTQLHQYKVFVNTGFLHILKGCPTLKKLYEIERFPWDKQALLCIEWLHQQLNELPGLIKESIVSTLDESSKINTKDILMQQNNLFNNMNQSDINEVLHTLIHQNDLN